MIKVKNKKILRALAGKAYRGNLRQNLMMVVSIAMTAFLITVVFSLGVSYYKTVTERNLASEGIQYDVALPEPTDEQIRKTREFDGVKDAGLSVKCAVVDGKDNQDRIRLYWADEICWEKQCQPAYVRWEGTYPKNENEIMLSLQSLAELGIEQPECGMEIALTWGSLAAESDLRDCETVFRLTGWFEEYGNHNNGYIAKAFYEKTGVKQTDMTNGLLYISLENPLYSSAYIKKLGDQIGLTGNQVIYSDPYLLTKFIRLTAGLVFLTVMTLISGYLFVYNLFYISVSREIRNYGQFKTIGMTGSQMKTYLLWQIGWSVLLGAPSGLLLGSMTALGAVPHLLGVFSGESGKGQVVAFHPMLLLFAAIFTMLVVWSGCRQLLRKVAGLTPIEAVRFHESIRPRRQRRNTKEVGIFRMALWNVFRNRKRFVISAASLCMIVMVYLVVSVVLQQNSAKSVLNQQYRYDARILNSRLLDDPEYAGITEALAEQVGGVDGIKTVRRVYSQEVQYDYEDTYEIMRAYLEDVSELPMMSKDQMKENLDIWKNESWNEKNGSYQGKGRLVGINEAEFDVLNAQAGGRFDKAAFLRGEGAIAFGFLSNVSTKSLIGKTLRFQVYGQAEEESVTVKWSGDGVEEPNVLPNDVLPGMVVCEERFRQVVSVPIMELLDVEYEAAFDTAANQALTELLENHKDLRLSTKLDDYERMYENELRLRVIGSSLCAILAVLTFLNYGNMMAVSIQSRRRELAAMRSIGMTRRQQNAMMAAEGSIYAVIAGGISLAAGVPLSYVTAGAVNTYHTPYQLPALPNLLLFAVLFAFCSVIPVALYRFLHRGQLVELLKK